MGVSGSGCEEEREIMWAAGRVVCLVLLVVFLNHEGSVFFVLIFLALVPFELVAKLESDMVIQKNLIAFRHVAFLKRAGQGFLVVIFLALVSFEVVARVKFNMVVQKSLIRYNKLYLKSSFMW